MLNIHPTWKSCQTKKPIAFTIHLKDHLIMVKNQQCILSLSIELEYCVF